MGLPTWHSGKESACKCRRYERHVFDPWAGKISWNRTWQHAPVFLPGKFHEQKSLAGYSLRQCRAEHDWWLSRHTHCSKLLQPSPAHCNPMRCSLLGSSVHGVLHSRIQEWIAPGDLHAHMHRQVNKVLQCGIVAINRDGKGMLL